MQFLELITKFSRVAGHNMMEILLPLQADIHSSHELLKQDPFKWYCLADLH